MKAAVTRNTKSWQAIRWLSSPPHPHTLCSAPPSCHPKEARALPALKFRRIFILASTKNSLIISHALAESYTCPKAICVHTTYRSQDKLVGPMHQAREPRYRLGMHPRSQVVRSRREAESGLSPQATDIYQVLALVLE